MSLFIAKKAAELCIFIFLIQFLYNEEAKSQEINNNEATVASDECYKITEEVTKNNDSILEDNYFHKNFMIIIPCYLIIGFLIGLAIIYIDVKTNPIGDRYFEPHESAYAAWFIVAMTIGYPIILPIALIIRIFIGIKYLVKYILEEKSLKPIEKRYRKTLNTIEEMKKI